MHSHFFCPQNVKKCVIMQIFIHGPKKSRSISKPLPQSSKLALTILATVAAILHLVKLGQWLWHVEPGNLGALRHRRRLYLHAFSQKLLLKLLKLCPLLRRSFVLSRIFFGSTLAKDYLALVGMLVKLPGEVVDVFLGNVSVPRAKVNQNANKRRQTRFSQVNVVRARNNRPACIAALVVGAISYHGVNVLAFLDEQACVRAD